MKQERAQRGLAAVVAILIVALAASASAYMLWQHSLALRQIENIATRAQADAIARAAASLSSVMLKDDSRQSDHLDEIWALRMPPWKGDELGGAELAGELTDEQSKFNLNNLVKGGKPSDPDIEAFKRLLGILSLSEQVVDALVDWMDADSEPRANGAEDLFYLGLDPPYRTANRVLSDVNELRRIKGFDDALMVKLLPYVTALPAHGGTKVNLNTASAQVLRAVTNLNAGDVKIMMDARPIKDPAKDMGKIPTEIWDKVKDLLDIKTEYFSAFGTVRIGRVVTGYRVILERPSQANSWPIIISVSNDSP